MERLSVSETEHERGREGGVFFVLRSDQRFALGRWCRRCLFELPVAATAFGVHGCLSLTTPVRHPQCGSCALRVCLYVRACVCVCALEQSTGNSQNVGLPGGEDGVLLLFGVRGLGAPAGGTAAAAGPPPHVLPQVRFFSPGCCVLLTNRVEVCARRRGTARKCSAGPTCRVALVCFVIYGFHSFRGYASSADAPTAVQSGDDDS